MNKDVTSYYDSTDYQRAVDFGKTTEWLLHPADRGGKPAKLVDFLSFVRLGDTPEAIQGKFYTLLVDLFAQTGDLWHPSFCYCTESLEQVIRIQQFAKRYGALIEPRQYLEVHYWLTALFPEAGSELIIDPFGTPTPGVDYYKYPRSIIPFFGIPELAPNKAAERYYDLGEELKRGYNRFRM